MLVGIQGETIKELRIGRRKVLASEMQQNIHDNDVPKMKIQAEEKAHTRIDKQKCLGHAHKQQKIGK